MGNVEQNLPHIGYLMYAIINLNADLNEFLYLLYSFIVVHLLKFIFRVVHLFSTQTASLLRKQSSSFMERWVFLFFAIILTDCSCNKLGLP